MREVVLEGAGRVGMLGGAGWLGMFLKETVE